MPDLSEIDQRIAEIQRKFDEADRDQWKKRQKQAKEIGDILEELRKMEIQKRDDELREEILNKGRNPLWHDGPTPAEGRRYLRERNELAKQVADKTALIKALEASNALAVMEKANLRSLGERLRKAADLAEDEKLNYKNALSAAEKVLKTSQEENATLGQDLRENDEHIRACEKALAAANDEANRLSGPDRWAAANVTLDKVDPTLLWLLRRCADEWGWEGVVRTAYRLQQEAKRLASTAQPKRVLKDDPQA